MSYRDGGQQTKAIPHKGHHQNRAWYPEGGWPADSDHDGVKATVIYTEHADEKNDG